MRIPFVFQTVDSDEAGYLVIAKAWRNTGVLYEPVWADRPQGIFGLYRLWLQFSWSPESIRMLAVFAGLITAIALGDIARSLAGDVAKHLAMFLGALMLASPLLDGYVANGEILAMSFSLTGIAIACRVLKGNLPGWWWWIAGACGGVAVMVKQSAFDGLVGIGLLLLVAGVRSWRPWSAVIRALGMYVAGSALMVALFFWHGIFSYGWHEYWYIVYGYHGEHRSVWQDPRIEKFVINTLLVIPVFVVPSWIIIKRIQKPPSIRMPRSETAILCGLWLFACTLAFVTGGQFHRHYFLVIVPPLVVACSVLLSRFPENLNRILNAHLAVAVLSTLVVAVILPGQTNQAVHVADWIRAESKRQGRELTAYAFCTKAILYAELDQIPQYKYVWHDGVELVKDAGPLLLEYLSGDDAPDVFVHFNDCKIADEITDYIATHYSQATTIDGVDVLLRRSG